MRILLSVPPPIRPPAMIAASETLILQHREVAALLATYALFLGGVFAAAWLGA